MKLNQIIDTSIDMEIQGIMMDSREVVPNSIFFCLPGLSVDSHKFIENAITNGAIVVIGTQDIECSIPYFKVDDIYPVFSSALQEFYDYPSSKVEVFGVTGTNGKSTTTKTLKNILDLMGEETGYIGTISIEYKDVVHSPKLTTPNALILQQSIKNMVDSNVSKLALEVSSHGIAMHRLDGVSFDWLAFTNLSHDHLDYHNNMEEYFETKASIFKQVKPNHIIINHDDSYGEKLMKRYPESITFGQNQESTYVIKNIELDTHSTRFILSKEGKEYVIQSPLVALFNVYNLTCALVMLDQSGYELEEIIPKLKDLPHVEGRLKMIEEGQDYRIFVDYAHAPDSMEKVLEYVKMTSSGRIITIFGSAGSRDTLKRPEMGAVSDTYSDYIILTEDDYRDENPLDINQEIAQGIKNTPYNSTNDRYEAIKQAISMAHTDDSIVIFGKGEETYMYAKNNTKLPWMGDHIAATKLIKEKLENE